MHKGSEPVVGKNDSWISGYFLTWCLCVYDRSWVAESSRSLSLLTHKPRTSCEWTGLMTWALVSQSPSSMGAQPGLGKVKIWDNLHHRETFFFFHWNEPLRPSALPLTIHSEDPPGRSSSHDINKCWSLGPRLQWPCLNQSIAAVPRCIKLIKPYKARLCACQCSVCPCLCVRLHAHMCVCIQIWVVLLLKNTWNASAPWSSIAVHLQSWQAEMSLWQLLAGSRVLAVLLAFDVLIGTLSPLLAVVQQLMKFSLNSSLCASFFFLEFSLLLLCCLICVYAF